MPDHDFPLPLDATDSSHKIDSNHLPNRPDRPEADPIEPDLIEPETMLLSGSALSSTGASPLWKVLLPFCILAPLCAVALWLDQSAPGTIGPTPRPSTTITSGADATPTENGAPAATLDNLWGASNQKAEQQPTIAQGQPTSPLSSLAPGQNGQSNQPNITPPVALAAPTPPPNSPGRTAFLQGEEALRRQMPDEAKRAYQEALHLDASLAPAHLRLADLAARGNDAREAQFHLEAAARLLPNDATPRLQLSQLFLQTRQLQKAETTALGAVQAAKGPLKRMAQANYARILTANKKEAQAYQIWRAMLQSNGQDVEAALSASLLAGRKLNKAQEAKTLMAQAIKTPPANPDVTLLLAGVLAEQKRAEDANKVLLAGTRKFPRFIPLHLSLAELRLARGDTKGALATLRALLPRVPKNIAGGSAKAEVHIALAQTLAHSRQIKPALAEAKSALQLQPRNPAVVAAVAELHFATGDAKSGINTLKNLLKLDPKNPQTRHALAEALARTNQWDAAQKELETYIKSQPQDLNALAEMALLHERRGKRDAALQVWSNIAQKQPNHPLAPLQQGRLLALLGRSEKALERYRAALKMAPNEPNALMGAAELEEKQGEAGAALNHLKTFINIEPKFDPAYAALMRVAKKQKQEEQAVGFLKQQLAKNPDRRGAYAALLDYYESIGKVESGRAFVRGYVDENPKLTAPRLAIEEFDLRRAKASLAELLKKDKASALNADRTGNPAETTGQSNKGSRQERGSTLPVPGERGSTLPVPQD